MALRTAEPLLRGCTVGVRLQLPAELPHVVVQAGPIRQALLLVLLEAIRLAPGGEIVLEACAEPNQVTLTVRSLHPTPRQRGAELDKLAVARQIAELSGSQLETITGTGEAPFVAGDVPFVAHLHLRVRCRRPSYSSKTIRTRFSFTSATWPAQATAL